MEVECHNGSVEQVMAELLPQLHFSLGSALSLVIFPGIYPEGLTEAQAYLDLTDNERRRLDSNSGSLAFTHCRKATAVDPDIKEVSRALVALGRQMPTGQDRIIISI